VTTYTWPTDIATPSDFSLKLRQAGFRATSNFGLSGKNTDLVNESWEAKLTVSVRDSDDAAEFEAFVNKLRMGVNSVRLKHYARSTPQGTLQGLVTVADTALAGSNTLTLIAAEGSTLFAGDFLEVNGQLMEVAEDCQATGDGLIRLLTTSRLKAEVQGFSRSSSALHTLDGVLKVAQAGQLRRSEVLTPMWEEAWTGVTNWTLLQGSGERTTVLVSDGYANRALQVGNNAGSDVAWLAGTQLFEVKADEIYCLDATVRVTQGTGRVYSGWLGVAADGVTHVNVLGEATYSNSHYHGFHNTTLTSNVWTRQIAYTKGYGAVVGSNSTTSPVNRGVLHPKVKFLRPMLIVNHGNETGITQVGPLRVSRLLSPPLLESAGTNLYASPTDITTPSFTLNECSQSTVADAVPLVGVGSARLIRPTAVSAVHFFAQDMALASGQWYTGSIFVKSSGYFLQITGSTGFATNFANFDLRSGSVVTVPGVKASIEPFGGGWFRCSLTLQTTSSVPAGRMVFGVVPAANSARLPVFAGDGVSGVICWGAQFETTQDPTSFMQTSREADVLNASANLDNPEGTFRLTSADSVTYGRGGVMQSASFSFTED